jgi:hypothetical protein
MKYIITENSLRRVQFKYLDYLFEDMYEVESKNYPDSRFWKKDDEVVLELHKWSGNLYVSYSIWGDISSMFSLYYDEVQQLIGKWAENRLESGEVTANSGTSLTKGRWRHI